MTRATSVVDDAAAPFYVPIASIVTSGNNPREEMKKVEPAVEPDEPEEEEHVPKAVEPTPICPICEAKVQRIEEIERMLPLPAAEILRRIEATVREGKARMTHTSIDEVREEHEIKGLERKVVRMALTIYTEAGIT